MTISSAGGEERDRLWLQVVMSTFLVLVVCTLSHADPGVEAMTLCNVHKNVECDHHDIRDGGVVSSAEECCVMCLKEPGCGAWTFNRGYSNHCWLKHECPNPVSNGKTDSGWAPPVTPMPPPPPKFGCVGGYCVEVLEGPYNVSDCAGVCPVDPTSEKARKVVSQMTLDEKVTMLHGHGCPWCKPKTKYTGIVPPIDRLGIPGVVMNDGPQGFRNDDCPGTSTQWPCGLAIAAGFDVNLARAWGEAMGEEFRGKAANVQLGPGVNIARVPLNGRNFEYCSGEDPRLGYEIIYNVVSGVQSKGIISTAKHYINNNQETNRGSVSEDVDERTEMEIYLQAFMGAVDAGSWAIMCSYNMINGIFSCESNSTLNWMLKGLGGFRGFVMSDWGGTHSTVDAAMHGLDHEEPNTGFFDTPLAQAVQNGQVPQAVVDDKVFRMVLALMSVGAFNRTGGDYMANVTSLAHNSLARSIAGQAAVLLTNNGILPLSVQGYKKVAIIGKPAQEPVTGGTGSGRIHAPYIVSILDAFRTRLSNAQINYDDGSDISRAVNVAKGSGLAVVVGATDSGEGSDRPSLSLGSDELMSQVGKAQPNTIVIAIAPGAILTPFSDDVAATLLMFLPGQEEGNAAYDVLFGDVNPSGRLPLSLPNKDNEIGFTPQQYPGVNGHATYSEKLQVGYRWYTSNNVKPKFAFGHGLSYTNFSYSSLVTNSTGVSFTVTNSGTLPGAEVPQLYLRYPESAGEPPLQLRGFRKVSLGAGQATSVVFPLVPRDVSIWDVGSREWVIQRGTFGVSVGASSADIRLSGSFVV